MDQEQQPLLALQAISSRISAIFDLEPLLEELVQSSRSIFGHHNALVFLADEEEEELYLAASGRPLTPQVRKRRFKIGAEELLGRVASTGKPAVVPDVSQNDSCTSSSPETRSAISIPMFVGGRLVGVFQVESDRVAAFDERDLQLMTTVANQAAAAIEAARLLRESRANAVALERRARNLMLINRVSTTLNSSLDAYEILKMTIQHLVDIIDVHYGNVLILEHDGQHAQIITEYPSETGPANHLRLSLPPRPSVQQVLELGIPYVVEDATDYPLLEPLQQELPSLKFGSLLLVPMVARRDMIGILLLASLGQHRSFSDEELEICQTIASQAAVAVANARLLQDIQRQRRALARKSQELTAASSKLDAILNNIADGLVVTDPAGRIILSNPAFRKMTAPPQIRSPYGRLLAETFHIEGLQSLVNQALELPGQVFTENLELPDGRVLKTSATALRIPPPILSPEEGEQIAGVVTILRDITHEVEVDRMKTDFISAVSHELRSPLTSVLGFANLIQRDFSRWIAPHLKPKGQLQQVANRIMDNLTIIEEESQRLTRLINDLLDIAKIEASHTEWRMESNDLTDVIQRGIAATTALAEEKNLPIQVHLPSYGLPPVWGHRDRLIQVMTNLLSNAIKFTDQGHVQVSAYSLYLSEKGPERSETDELETQNESHLLHLHPGEWVIVNVTDTGIGIQTDDTDRIFEKFTQVGDTLTEKPAGTGLGLSICKGIIEHHGGHIWVESVPHRGSTFSFALPVFSPTERERQNSNER